MKSPQSVKEVQQLTSRLAALSRFLPAAVAKSYHFFNMLRKAEKEQNYSADILSKLATYRIIDSPETLSHLMLTEPSLDVKSVLSLSQVEDWRSSLIHYLRTGEIPEKENLMSFRHKASHYTIIGENLYKHGFSRPLLKCLRQAKAEAAIDEVHDSICGHHAGGRSLTTRILRVGYYWPILRENCKKKVQECDACQKCAPLIQSSTELLHLSDISWPFHKWGIDIFGPFSISPRQALKKKLTDAKGCWAELIPEILWSYNTTPQSTTKETPFRLVYGSGCMIPIEVGQGSTWTEYFDETANKEARSAELDTINEERCLTELRQKSMQLAMQRQYNKKVRPRTLKQGDLVLRQIEEFRKPSGHGKLSATWEGPFWISKFVGRGAYCLETLDGIALPNT
ncbi:uncharacterized protein [Arachis hypogaea]|uniref:uncharacterized protein n=1 Tax=Arachis hypogaea TaxID=3818 RepID=UPI0007AF01F4